MASTSEQMWLFLYEEKSSVDFKVVSKGFEDFALAGFSFRSILTFLDLEETNADDFSFFLFSGSMKAAVQLLTDKSLIVTYRLYCEDDHTVTLIVRPVSDPSPNSSQCPSAPNSLRERRKLSGRHQLQDVFVRPVVGVETKNLDAETRFPINELPESEKVFLDLGKGRIEVFSASYLRGWIMAEVARGTPLDNIIVTNFTPKGRPSRIKLDRDVWARSLLRGTNKGEFLKIWDSFAESQVARTDALKALYQEFPYVYTNMRVFIRDLRSFGTKHDSRARLGSTDHQFFLGKPYFSAAAVERILALPIPPSTLNGHLVDLLQRKGESELEDEICASHDLAPIFLRAFGLSWSELKKEDPVLQEVRDKHAGTLGRNSAMETFATGFSKIRTKYQQKGGDKVRTKALRHGAEMDVCTDGE